MRNKRLKTSLLIAASASLVAGAVGTAFAAQGGTANPRKSAWTPETAPRQQVVQVKEDGGNTSPGGKSFTPPSGEAAYSDNRIIVKYKEGFSSPSRSVLDAGKLTHRSAIAGWNAEAITLESPSDVKAMIAELSHDPHVAYAEPNYKLFPASSDPAANDTFFDRQWSLLNTGQDPSGLDEFGTPGIDMQVPDAWNITKGSSDVIVAVIDSGVQIDHPDLAGSIWTNTKDYAGNGKDDDHNGYVDDVHGWNFFGNNNQLFDEADGDAHGTEVAGLIAAQANNDIGVAGVAPEVKIMPLKVVNDQGFGNVLDVIEAIRYAEKNGAKIANISAAMYSYSQALKDAIDASSMLFIAPAGNNGGNIDEMPVYPAAYESPNILSVTGIMNTGELLPGANIGFESVDIAAPGFQVWMTRPITNPGLSAQIDDGTSKIIFNGLPFENILDEEDADRNYRQDAFDRAMEYLGASKNDPGASILLVQDDGSNLAIPSSSKLAKYKALLEDYAGFDESRDIVASAPNGGDGPSADFLKQYDVVIWFTGVVARDFKNITDNDQLQLKEYLTSGKNLLLTGSHSLNGIEDSDFVQDVLHLLFVDEDFYSTASGVPGTIYEGLEYPLDEDKDSYNWVVSKDPSIAKVNLQSIGEPPHSVYTYLSGTSFAAANASGAAALVQSQEPSLGALAVKQRLMNSGVRLSSLMGRVATGSMINAYRALTDDDIPGTPFAGGTVVNALDEAGDRNDVYALDLHAGDKLTMTLTGDKGTDFDLYLYSPGAVTVRSNEGIAAYSENTGTSNESIAYAVTESGTYYLNVYAHKGSGTYTLSVVSANNSGTYEETDGALGFTGAWENVAGAAYSGGSAKRIDAKGSVEFAFVGSYIGWMASKNDQQGIADVYIDGVKVASPTLFAASAVNRKMVFEQLVPYGPHSLTIKWTGRRDTRSKKTSSTYINVDAISVDHLVQDSDVSTVYDGHWTTNFSSKHFGGTAKTTNMPDASAEFKFTGSKAALLAFTGPNRGQANIYIDGELATPQPIDLYSAEPRFRAKVFESERLTEGKHTLKIVSAGTKNAASSGSYLSVDAVSILH